MCTLKCNLYIKYYIILFWIYIKYLCNDFTDHMLYFKEYTMLVVEDKYYQDKYF